MAFYPNQLQKYFLAGAGAVIGATSVVLKSMLDIDGNPLTMATDFGAVGYGTLEPGNNTLEESISFTGLTNNSNGTVTLTGVSSVLFDQPYTKVSGLTKTHAGSTTFVVSNTSGFYNEFPSKQNNETITGQWTVPTPLGSGVVANKAYVDNVAGSGTVTTNALTVAGTAGENLVAGQIVYFKVSDGRWYKASSVASATTDLLQLGVVQSTTTIGNPITSGVLLRGIDTNQTGLVAGTIYYLSTGGAIASSAGAVERAIGQAVSATSILFDPDYFYIPTANQKGALAGSTGTPSATNKFVTEDDRISSPTGAIIMFSGSSAPIGWLLCDGSAVSRTTYANLFVVVSTTYGAGNGSTTFNVPDLRSRMPIGVGTGTKVATFASRASNVITVTGLTNQSNNEFQTGQAVVYHTSSGVITGLSNDTTYYVIRISNTTFSLATTLANAQNGTAISLSSDGTGTQTFTLTMTARALAETGGEENHAMSATELLSHTHQSPNDSFTRNPETAGGTSTFGSSSITGASGGNAAMSIINPFLVLNYLIKI